MASGHNWMGSAQRYSQSLGTEYTEKQLQCLTAGFRDLDQYLYPLGIFSCS